LEKVANVLQRWHPGRIIVLGDALKQRPVTLVVNLNRTSDVLPLVGKVLSVEVDQIGDYVTILREA
jgi:transmembrane sensor